MKTANSPDQQIVPAKGEIILYHTADGKTSIDVKLENETVWLTQAQMAVLFETTKQNISLHVNNVFREGELEKEMVVKESLITTSHGAMPGKTQTGRVFFYNLDVIISVGYRVKSKRGTQFRIWANSVLKDYLVKGYAVRNNLVQQKYDDLKALVDVMGRTMGYLESPAGDQIRSIFDVVRDYTYALDTLDGYDYHTLGIRSTRKEYFHATYDNAMVVKNHSFTDGNKRIAATLFLWFMENNRILYSPDGHKRIADNALVALTLMIAESKTDEMDIMVKVVVNLINGDNI